MASELATNALRHAGTEYDVTLTQDGHRLVLEVRDYGSGIRSWAPDRDGGRGLLIAEALTSRLVFDVTEAGVCVRAEFDQLDGS